MGSLNVFNHQSNVDIDNRIVCYDIKELEDSLKKIGMLVVIVRCGTALPSNARQCNWLLHRRLYLLLKEEQTAAYRWKSKRFRNLSISVADTIAIFIYC